MLYPQVDAQDWANLYSIETRVGTCCKCKESQVFTTPFAYGEFRGLLSDHTQCGEEYRQSVFVVVNKQERNKLSEFVDEMATAALVVL